ncbi:hypothetical protein AB0D32_13055 [Micromonospora sp. NPDC048170]|uniref:hypothetical protein n=1 Tax=Micromonospora sp. NPDC048170 TaxID=3154819 RepID=UPI0033C6BC6B
MSGFWRRLSRRIGRVILVYGWCAALTHPMGPPMPQQPRRPMPRSADRPPGSPGERDGLDHA